MERSAVQRRTVGTLMAANVFAYAGFVGVVAVSALLAREMLGSDSLAGIPAAAATLGTAAAATPLALRSRRRGRRRGVQLGYLVGIAGSLAALLSGIQSLFWLLVLAAALIGIGQASTLQSRYAAADLAEEGTMARDIALVVWMGTVGGVTGPLLAGWVNRMGTGLGLAEWASPMSLGAIGFLLGWIVIEVWLRPDPLELAGGVEPDARHANPLSGVGHALRVVWANPRARLAVTAMAVSQMAMVAVMVMTPLHMRDHGHAQLSLLVISAHILGMYALAPLIGRRADRRGRVRALKEGAVILGAGTLTTVTAGYVPALMFVGLFLLGLGWNFAFVAGSALLTESLPRSERVGAQGLSDVLMSLLAAFAAMGSGLVKTAFGFHWLANFATAAAVLIFLSALTVARTEPVAVTSG